MIRTIIFDAYGTLFSTGTGSIDAASKILKAVGGQIEPKAFYSRWKELHRIHINGCIQENCFITEEELFKQDLKILYEEWGIISDYTKDVKPMLQSLTGRKLFDDVAEVIASLRESYTVAIGSTTDTAPLISNLEASGLKVDKVFTSESLKCYKPDPQFYQKILEYLATKPQEAIFIGDSLLDDVFGPQNIGIRGIWLNRNHKSLTVQGEKEPAGIIQTLQELPQLIKDW